MLELTNTLGGKKERFKPISNLAVGMYNCGPTVYDYPHIGNLRKYVFDDILRRALEFNGYTVNQVINITDVGHLVSDADTGEDRMEKAVKREKKSAQELAEFFTQAFFDDLEILNIKAFKDKEKESHFPRATHHIQEQINLIKILEEKGYTYRISDGIYFDTKKFKDYGKLGNINIEGLKEGARVEINTEKRNPTDFALWKFSQLNEKRQQEWPSPWGVGFPGWHIECSAMSMKYLGETFDIHTGGIDHIPVHHNNEIAQSEAATGQKFVNYWLHQAFLNIDNTKISKSLGNIIRLKDLVERGINPLAYRYWLLTAHYRTSVNFTEDAIDGAQTAYNKIIEAMQKLGVEEGPIDVNYLDRFKKYINDDLDTPQAVALMWELVKDQHVHAPIKKSTLLEFDKVLGLDLSTVKKVKIPKQVQTLIDEREVARGKKDFEKSDELRDKIKKLGFDVKDTAEGPEVQKA
jgi:cysteinyl-tRNA synthetase